MADMAPVPTRGASPTDLPKRAQAASSLEQYGSRVIGERVLETLSIAIQQLGRWLPDSGTAPLRAKLRALTTLHIHPLVNPEPFESLAQEVRRTARALHKRTYDIAVDGNLAKAAITAYSEIHFVLDNVSRWLAPPQQESFTSLCSRIAVGMERCAFDVADQLTCPTLDTRRATALIAGGDRYSSLRCRLCRRRSLDCNRVRSRFRGSYKATESRSGATGRRSVDVCAAFGDV
jgi:hypothetical protein